MPNSEDLETERTELIERDRNAVNIRKICAYTTSGALTLLALAAVYTCDYAYKNPKSTSGLFHDAACYTGYVIAPALALITFAFAGMASHQQESPRNSASALRV